MAFLDVRHGCDRAYNPKGFEWPSIHFCGHRLFYQMDRSSVVCECDEVSGSLIHQKRNLVPYRPKMNGVVEVTNKNVKKIIAKTIETYRIGTRSYLLHYMSIKLEFGH